MDSKAAARTGIYPAPTRPSCTPSRIKRSPTPAAHRPTSTRPPTGSPSSKGSGTKLATLPWHEASRSKNQGHGRPTASSRRHGLRTSPGMR